MQQGHFPIPPPPPPLTPEDKKVAVNIYNLSKYERDKIENVRKNNEVLRALNLPVVAEQFNNELKKFKGKGRMKEVSEEYVPGNEEELSAEEVSKIPKKVCHS